MGTAADFGCVKHRGDVAGECADGSDHRKQDEAQLSAFTATVDAFEAQLYGPTKQIAERPKAKGADRAAKEPV